jgi:glycosyltransferase involved in cell wall biosynthesis
VLTKDNATLAAVPERRARLLYVVTLAEVGGAQSYVRALLAAANEAYDVTVAAHGDGPLREAALDLGIPFVDLRHVRRPISLIEDFLGLLELMRLFRRVRPDLVHLNSSKAGILGRVAARLVRVPVCVFTAHGWAFGIAATRTAVLYRRAERFVRPLATAIICVCDADRRAGLEAGTCEEERTVVIPNAVEVGPTPDYSRPGSGPVEIVAVGRLAEQKDFSTLIAAVALLPAGSVRLRVLGDGPLRQRLEAEIVALGLPGVVELVGEVADVRTPLGQADIFALTSRWEGLPLSILEAMAAGLPVVAAAVDGVPEAVVQGETGFLVSPGDPDETRAALARLADDPELRTRLGRAGRRRAEELFSLPRWRAAHLALYRTLLRTGSERDPIARRPQ